MNVADNARELVSAASSFLDNAVSNTNSAGLNLSVIFSSLSLIRELSGNSISVAGSLLGGNHPALGAIISTGKNVDSKADEIQTSISQLETLFLNLDSAVNTHASTMGTVGNNIMRNSES